MSTPSNALVSDTPLWGQAWTLTITATTDGQSTQTTIDGTAWSPEPLRITFDVMQAMNSSPIWYADISVYNLDSTELQNLLLTATWVTLQAGFMTGPNIYSTIWDGRVFQSIYTRENVADQKITLHCVASPAAGINQSIVAFAVGPYRSQASLLATMAQETGQPPISHAQGTAGPVADQRLNNTTYPRGNTVFGQSNSLIAQLADSNFLQSWNDGKKAYISEIGSNTVGPPNLIYAPPYPPGAIPATQDLPPGTTQSLIGTPQQVQQGVAFTVLLDPRLRVGLPPQLVQLVRLKTISTTTYTPLVNNDYPTALSANLLFYVAQVRHVGDSRGNDWHTEVIGYSTAQAQVLLAFLTS
jgi:hypothetical protein